MNNNYEDVVSAIKFISNLGDNYKNSQINDHLKTYQKKWENGGPFVSAIQSIIDNQTQRSKFSKDVSIDDLYIFLKRFSPGLARF